MKTRPKAASGAYGKMQVPANSSLPLLARSRYCAQTKDGVLPVKQRLSRLSPLVAA